MISEFVKSIWLILPVTLATIVLEALRLRLAPRAEGPSLPGAIIGYLVAGLGFGMLAILVYNWIGGHWPENGAQIFLWLALGLAVVLTLLAIMMRFVFTSPTLDVVIWTAMNFIWGIGYGWYLPQILTP